MVAADLAVRTRSAVRQRRVQAATAGHSWNMESMISVVSFRLFCEGRDLWTSDLRLLVKVRSLSLAWWARRKKHLAMLGHVLHGRDVRAGNAALVDDHLADNVALRTGVQRYLGVSGPSQSCLNCPSSYSTEASPAVLRVVCLCDLSGRATL